MGLVFLKRTAFNSNSFSNLILHRALSLGDTVVNKYFKTDYRNRSPSKKKKFQYFKQRKFVTFLKG